MKKSYFFKSEFQERVIAHKNTNGGLISFQELSAWQPCGNTSLASSDMPRLPMDLVGTFLHTTPEQGVGNTLAPCCVVI